jgi:glucose-6-phosphate 1-dehydrogenase
MADTVANNISVDPSVIVIFGISGDLAKRKVLPSIYRLLKSDLLTSDIHIIGTSRQNLSEDDLIKDIEPWIIKEDRVCDPVVIKKLRSVLEIIKFDPTNITAYAGLKTKLDKYEKDHGTCFNRLFYLSIPPQVFGPIVRNLGESGLSNSCSHGKAKSRLLVEKPFGYDLVSAKDLIKEAGHYFSEDQIFRIDHYLAKETAQNILTFRKFNPLFKEIWNNKFISKVTVRAVESIGIEGRANFYDNVGALRDLIQSHLLQLLAITTMELPKDITDSDQIHRTKLALFKDILPFSQKDLNTSVVRGQYASYKQEVGNPKTSTETYVKMKLFIKNKRWSKVPIILETGKALKNKQTDVTIDFGSSLTSDNCNQLTFRLQPNEGIDIKLLVKKPGLENIVQATAMDFSYKATFDDREQPDAYERVLVDAIKGDQALFASSSEVIRSWQILEPVLNSWQKSADDLIIYQNGSLGPTKSL